MSYITCRCVFPHHLCGVFFFLGTPPHHYFTPMLFPLQLVYGRAYHRPDGQKPPVYGLAIIVGRPCYQPGWNCKMTGRIWMVGFCACERNRLKKHFHVCIFKSVLIRNSKWFEIDSTDSPETKNLHCKELCPGRLHPARFRAHFDTNF